MPKVIVGKGKGDPSAAPFLSPRATGWSNNQRSSVPITTFVFRAMCTTSRQDCTTGAPALMGHLAFQSPICGWEAMVLSARRLLRLLRGETEEERIRASVRVLQGCVCVCR